MKSESNISPSTTAPVADNPVDGHWTAPEVTIAVIIGLTAAGVIWASRRKRAVAA